MALWLCLAAATVTAQPAPPPPAVDAGLGRGVTLRAADGQASMNIRARIQVRSTFVNNADADDTSEFLIRRARLVFQGDAAGSALTYYMQLSFANLDNEVDLRLPLRDAYVTWTAGRDASVRIGQMKVPFSRQRVVSSSALQMVDRSPVVSELNLDRDVGVQLFSRDLFGLGRLGYAVGLFGGEGRNRLGRTAGLLYTGRLEAWPFGAFDDYVEGDVQRRRAFRLAVGVNAAYNQNTNRPRSTIGTPFAAGDVDYRHAGADMSLKWRGWSLTSELMYRGADRPAEQAAPSAPLARSGWGAYLQGGVMLGARTELTTRYSHLTPARGTDPGFVTTEEIGAGLSYYLRGHDLKVQADYVHVREPAPGRTTQQLRAQFQLFF